MTDARTFRCASLLTRQGWQEPAFVTVDGAGVVQRIEASAPAGVQPVALDGLILPGFVNAHSHAFQYAMAGMAEHLPKAAASDDFWSWRESMYGLAAKVTPEVMQAIATMLYVELIASGYTHVAEFHYLHHDQSGRPYGDQGEMAHRLIAAAAAAGIGLTLLPVFYQRGGFGITAKPTQQRFLSRDPAAYRQLVDATRRAANGKSDVNVGLCLHSLRAVEADAVKEVYGWQDPAPLHVHVAEQRREVDECLLHLKQRPIAWLAHEVGIDRRTHLVHATHADDAELAAVARSGANVVLCPSTEANLGDGLFPLAAYHRAGGSYAIGTDSHIGLAPLEELRWLDYGQRLRQEKRNTLCEPGQDSGQQLFDRVWQGGQASIGSVAKDYVEVGRSFDAVVVDPDHPLMAGKPRDRRLSALVYGGDPRCLLGVLRRGQWLVKNGHHDRRQSAREQYRAAMAGLLA